MNYHSPVITDLSKQITISNTNIGHNNQCYVIAEAGSNHNRDLKTAIALIDAAADAGCDAIKFQSFTGDDIASKYQSELTKLPDEFVKWGKNLKELYKFCALPDSFYEPLVEHAHKRDIHLFSSPFSEKAVDRLVSIGVPALKIASFELVHLPLIQYAASTGIPLIMSTGMAGLGDIERAMDAATSAGATQISLMHCGSSYPLGPGGANLAAMDTLRQAFGVPVGYSDHTLGIGVPVAVATLGGSLLEKHITLSRSDDGPGHGFAIEPNELKDMVGLMHDAQLAVGSPKKVRQPEEEDNARRGRRSLFTIDVMRAGDVLDLDKVKVVRPGVGLEPMFLELLLGKRVNRDIPADHPLTWDDFIDS